MSLRVSLIIRVKRIILAVSQGFGSDTSTCVEYFATHYETAVTSLTGVLTHA